jgi:hypothetical protein
MGSLRLGSNPTVVVSVRSTAPIISMLHAITMTPAGLEPAIPGSVGRCLIHWATGPVVVPAWRTTYRHRIGLQVGGPGWQTRQSSATVGQELG